MVPCKRDSRSGFSDVSTSISKSFQLHELTVLVGVMFADQKRNEPIQYLAHPRTTVWMVKLVSRDINVVALVKGEERYIFLFNDKQKSETLRTLGRYASNSDLSFSWYDAAVLSQKVRNATKSDVEPASSDRRMEFPEVNDLFSGEEPIS